MAVVLTLLGAFLYVRLGSSLVEQIDDRLEARAGALRADVRARGDVTQNDVASADDEEFAQVLAADGALLASSASVGGSPVLTEEELRRGAREEFHAHRDSLAGLGGQPARLLVGPVVTAPGRTLVFVVGSSLEDQREALAGLLTQLLVVGPLALVLWSIAGYILCGAALRPVDAMRRRAAAVSSERPGQRLPLPRAYDEVYRLGETLNEMLARLEAAIARERRFVADASHELRTPLALLRAELELALRRPRSSDELEHALRSAAEEVERLTRLAEDLLVLAQLEEGERQLRRTELSSRDVLTTVARRFEPRAAALGRRLEVRATDEEVLFADRLRVEQALGNLVDNALRYGSGTVSLEAEAQDGHIELRVRDEGGGFPDEFLPRAFARFTRPGEARSGGGAGLGLAIVDAVARAHGGAARAVNSVGGPVVSLFLPLALSESPAQRRSSGSAGSVSP